MARRSDNMGFAFMGPERRRRPSREGGSSRGDRSRDYEEEYDEGYDEDYDEDEERGVSSRYEDQDYDEGYEEDEDEYEDTGYEDEDEYEDENAEDYGRGRRSQGRSSSMGGRRSSFVRSGRRGFAGMDPERQRRRARMGEEATSRSHGRDFYDETGYEGGRGVRDEYGPDVYSRIGRRVGQARWEDDNDDVRGRSRANRSYGEGRSSSGGSRRSSSDRSGSRLGMSSGRSDYTMGGRRKTSNSRGGNYPRRMSSGKRGFGSMSREEVRGIASKGGRTRWGQEEDDRGRGGRSNRGRGHGR